MDLARHDAMRLRVLLVWLKALSLNRHAYARRPWWICGQGARVAEERIEQGLDAILAADVAG